MASVVWLGGGCGAGKSTLARRLAYRYDLRLYPIDAYGYAHQRRAETEPGWPVQRAAAGLDFADRWLRPSVPDQVTRFLDHARERFAMVCGELDALPDVPLTLVEGPQLLPGSVAARGGPAVWLIPTARQVRRSRQRRGFAGPADPATCARVLETLIERDQLLADRLRGEVPGAYLDVDVTADWDRVAGWIADRLRLADGPRAVDGHQRQALRRDENAAVAANLTAYGDWVGAAPMPGPFVCECTTLGCAAQATMTAADYRARSGPLLLCGRSGPPAVPPGAGRGDAS